MIDLLFSFGHDVVLVRIDNHNLQFANTSQGAQMSTIDGLKLSKQGVEVEFHDLVGDDNWRDKAINRFKEKIKTMQSEQEITEYVINDLKKYGYKPMYKQKIGFRREKLNG